jgi:transcriptional regulator with XRE-family HTH domain
LPHFPRSGDCGAAPPPRSIEAMLHAEFERRRRTNRRFSLRAFAVLLGMDSSTVSQILRGRRRLSARLTTDVCARLALPARERDALVREARTRAHERRVLRQVARAGFVARSRPLARRLRLRTDDVNAALVRLLRDGRVQMQTTTHWAVRGPAKER